MLCFKNSFDLIQWIHFYLLVTKETLSVVTLAVFVAEPWVVDEFPSIVEYVLSIAVVEVDRMSDMTTRRTVTDR